MAALPARKPGVPEPRDAPGAPPPRGRHSRLSGTAALVAVAALISVALALLRGVELWNDSDGQYLMTGMLLADGHGLYGEVATSQPPLMYVLVAAATTIHDSWVSARVVFVGLQALTAVLVALLALRLGVPRWAALLGAAWALLTPWALHEHGAVLPEVVATPLLLGAVLAAGGATRRPRLAGLLGSLAIAAKLPMVVPVLALLYKAPDRRATGRALALGLAAQALVWSLWFGADDLLRGTVLAQTQIGGKAGRDAAAYVAQTGWSLLPLVVLGLIGWRIRARAGRDDLLAVLVATTGGALVTLVSILKLGTLPVIAIPVEALLLPLALVAVADLVAGGGQTRAALPPRYGARARPAAVASLALAVLAAGALLLSPGAPRGFTWPGGETNWARVASEAQVDRQRALAERCPPGSAWPGSVWIAVLSDRRVPGDQSDPFILQAPTYASRLARRRADRICRPPASAIRSALQP